jgi:ESX secretion-associated protein EspG
MTTTTGQQVLSPVALDFLWEALGAGDLPYPLELRSHGRTVDERRALRHQAHEQLRGSGLLDGRGRVEPDLEASLHTLAQPELSIDSVFIPERGAGAVLVLAATSRGATVLAVQRPDGLMLRPIPTDGLASAVVEQLPAARRGTEKSISVPADELGGRLGEPDRASTAETRAALARLTALPNLRTGQLGVNRRSDMRGRRRAPVLTWFDNESGRYLCQRTGSADGTDWVTVAPADAATLRHRLGEMAATLA